ncbi:MAG: DUF4091 domain-containing protein [Lentisphaerae bacterium]|nr:DUF4091 domain-containing protein [Lentisphaerota bacterium]
MKKIFSILFCAFFLTATLVAEVTIRENNGNVSAGNGEFAISLLANKNFAFNLAARGSDGKNFSAVIESIIWYHGRSGNTDHIYQDQSEKAWPLGNYRIEGNKIISRTGNCDFDVERIIEFFNDSPAVVYEYILTIKESRDCGHMRFPLTRLTKEITSVSFDDGTLQNFSTAEVPAPAALAHTRAMFFHIPARGKTLLMLIDVNAPLKYGHQLGLMPTYSPGSWCRSVNFNHLYMPAFPFYNAGDKLGVRLAFLLLDGAELTEAHKQAARELAEKVDFQPARFTPAMLDGEYRIPSTLAAQLPALPGIRFWSEIPAKRVYPAMNVPERRAAGITLTGAANERESIQLIFNPESECYLESIVFSDLTSADGKVIKAENFYANLLGIQKVASPRALFYGEQRFPDKLRELADALPAKMRAGQNTICHLTFFAPPGTAPGVYSGKVTVKIAGKSADIPVSLRVWGFELPRYSRYTAHGLLWSSLPEHREQVLARLAQYGMCGTVYPGGQRQLREIFDGNELRFKDNLDLAVKAVTQFNMSMFQAPYLFLGAWNWAPGKKVQFLNLDLESPEFERNFTNYLRSFHRQVSERGILDRSFIYMWDEMTGGHYAAMEKTVGMVHRYAPGVKLMTVSAPDPMVLRYNDIITTGPLGQWWSKETKAVVDQALSEGKQFWIYLNGVTFSPHWEAAIPRVTTWQCYVNGFTGYLQWSMDYNWQHGTFEKNGDVWILYPAYDKPVYSVRLEYFRDGVEDFNMMYLSRQLPPEIKAQIDREIARVAPVMGKMNPDPVLMYEVRLMIGNLLEKHLK